MSAVALALCFALYTAQVSAAKPGKSINDVVEYIKKVCTCPMPSNCAPLRQIVRSTLRSKCVSVHSSNEAVPWLPDPKAVAWSRIANDCGCVACRATTTTWLPLCPSIPSTSTRPTARVGYRASFACCMDAMQPACLRPMQSINNFSPYTLDGRLTRT